VKVDKGRGASVCEAIPEETRPTFGQQLPNVIVLERHDVFASRWPRPGAEVEIRASDPQRPACD